MVTENNEMQLSIANQAIDIELSLLNRNKGVPLIGQHKGL